MRKQNITALLLTGVITASLTACGDKKDNTANTVTKPQATNSVTTKETTKPNEPHIILNPSGYDFSGIDEEVNKRAENEFGLTNLEEYSTYYYWSTDNDFDKGDCNFYIKFYKKTTTDNKERYYSYFIYDIWDNGKGEAKIKDTTNFFDSWEGYFDLDYTIDYIVENWLTDEQLKKDGCGSRSVFYKYDNWQKVKIS